MKFILEYEFRSDNGPRRVGPFDTKLAAQVSADNHQADGWSAEYLVAPLISPEDDA